MRNARHIRVMLTPKSDHWVDGLAPPAKQQALDTVIVSANRDPVGEREILDAVVLGTSREADLAVRKSEAPTYPPFHSRR